MKRKIFLLGALALCLTGCGQKKQVKTLKIGAFGILYKKEKCFWIKRLSTKFYGNLRKRFS